MKSRFLITFMLIATILTACQKEEIVNEEPKVTEESVEVSAAVATFTWTVGWLGKFASVVEISENEDMSDSQTFGSEIETGNKDFMAKATGLKASADYYYRYLVWNKYYVDNKFKTEAKSFTTLYDGLAAVTTAEVSDIDFTTATCGGHVTYDGNHTVTERGVCWSTSHNPDISGSHMSSGDGIGSFTCSITNLEQGTQYYVRAYATNSVGTNYGNEVSFTTAAVPNYPTGAIKGLFSISGSEQVCFSHGNLQYRASDGKWQFAEHQYDVIGNDNSNISSSYSGWIDLFGWGTSGYNNKYPYMTTTSYGDYGDGSTDIAGTNYDWGVFNKITNGGNQAGLWRTLTKNEWVYVFITRSTISGIRFAKACVSGMNGVILLPDDWSSSYYSLNSTNSPGASFDVNTISASQWTSLEQHGAVFMPAAGRRYSTSVWGVGSVGDYWSASNRDSDSAYLAWFSGSGITSLTYDYRNDGHSVRLVCSVQYQSLSQNQ